MSCLCACGSDETYHPSEFSVENVRKNVEEANKGGDVSEQDKVWAKETKKHVEAYERAATAIAGLQEKKKLSDSEKKELKNLEAKRDEAEREMEKRHEEREKRKEKEAEEEHKRKKEKKDSKGKEEEDKESGDLDYSEVWEYSMKKFKENTVLLFVALICVSFGSGILGAGMIPLVTGFSNMIMHSDKQKDKVDIKYLFAFASVDNVKKWFMPGFVIWVICVACCYTWWVFLLPLLACFVFVFPNMPLLFGFKGETSVKEAFMRSKAAVLGGLDPDALKEAANSTAADLEKAGNVRKAQNEDDIEKGAKAADKAAKEAAEAAGAALDSGKGLIEHVKVCFVALVCMCTVIFSPIGFLMLHKRYLIILPGGNKIRDPPSLEQIGDAATGGAISDAKNEYSKAKKNFDDTQKAVNDIEMSANKAANRL